LTNGIFSSINGGNLLDHKHFICIK